MEEFQLEVFVFMLVLALYVLASYFIAKNNCTFLHESTVAIALGFASALIFKTAVGKDVSLSHEYFFFILLPPIVFSVGYTIKNELFQHFLTIVFFGTVSTLLTIVAQGGLLFALKAYLIQSLTVREVLLITIITSVNDPISSLPLLRSHSPTLKAMVSGESVLNCAVSIILFTTILSAQFTSSLSSDDLANIFLQFGKVFSLSVFLGMALGFALSYLFKLFTTFSEFHIKETSLILLTGYVVYFLGEFLGLSGIIALFATAIIFSKYGFQNLSEASRHGTVLIFESIRYLFQAFIFAFLGASLLLISISWSALGLSLLLVCLIPAIRLLSVSALPLIFKVSGRPFPLAKPERKLFWFTGLIKGIIAFALSLQIQSQNSSYLMTVCLLVVLFTTVAGSTFLNRFCQLIGLDHLELIRVGQDKPENKEIELAPSTKYGAIGTPEDSLEAEETDKGQKMAAFDQKFLRPIFVRDQSPGSSPDSKRVNNQV